MIELMAVGAAGFVGGWLWAVLRRLYRWCGLNAAERAEKYRSLEATYVKWEANGATKVFQGCILLFLALATGVAAGVVAMVVWLR